MKLQTVTQNPAAPKLTVNPALKLDSFQPPSDPGDSYEKKPSALDALKGPLALTAAMWGSELVDMAMGGSLDALGVVPRTTGGLLRVPLMPFLHGGMGHLMSNSVGMLTAGSMTALQSPDKFWDVTLLSGLASGLGVWATGAGLTVGASGLVYGYIGYNFANGVLNPSPKSIGMTVASGLLFASSLSGVLPGQAGISWQGHLFGLLGGIAAAAMLKDE